MYYSRKKENYKEAVIKANDIDTVVTGRSTGHPVQVIKNKLARQFMTLESNNAPVEELEKLGRGALPKAREMEMRTRFSYGRTNLEGL